MLIAFALQFWLSHRAALLADGDVASVSISETLIEGRFARTENGYDYFMTRRVDPELIKALWTRG